MKTGENPDLPGKRHGLPKHPAGPEPLVSAKIREAVADTLTEAPSREIIDHNLRMMDGPMRSILSTESIGGNAGVVTVDGKRCVCFAANGYMDQDGKIVAFGNCQNINPTIRKSYPAFTLQLAVMTLIVVDVFDSALPQRTKKSLRMSVAAWNEQKK